MNINEAKEKILKHVTYLRKCEPELGKPDEYGDCDMQEFWKILIYLVKNTNDFLKYGNMNVLPWEFPSNYKTPVDEEDMEDIDILDGDYPLADALRLVLIDASVEEWEEVFPDDEI